MKTKGHVLTRQPSSRAEALMSVTLELNLSTLEWVNKHTLHFKECRAVAEAECQSRQLNLGARAPSFLYPSSSPEGCQEIR